MKSSKKIPPFQPNGRHGRRKKIFRSPIFGGDEGKNIYFTVFINNKACFDLSIKTSHQFGHLHSRQRQAASQTHEDDQNACQRLNKGAFQRKNGRIHEELCGKETKLNWMSFPEAAANNGTSERGNVTPNCRCLVKRISKFVVNTADNYLKFGWLFFRRLGHIEWYLKYDQIKKSFSVAQSLQVNEWVEAGFGWKMRAQPQPHTHAQSHTHNHNNQQKRSFEIWY